MWGTFLTVGTVCVCEQDIELLKLYESDNEQ